MMRRVRATISGLALIVSLPVFGQDLQKIGVVAGAGFSSPVGRIDGRVNVGYNLLGGAGYNFNKTFGVLGEFGFQHFNLSDSTLTNAGAPGGNARLYSFTLNPVWRFQHIGRFQPYATFGGGYYRRTVEFTQPGVAYVTGYDPFYGVLFPATVGTTQVLGSYTQNKGGWNGGAGVSIPVGSDRRAAFFAEARYHYVYTTPGRTTYLPVTFGFRW